MQYRNDHYHTMKPRQLDLLPPEKQKRDRLFRRPGCRNWYCRVWVAGQWHRRSTSTRWKTCAKVAMRCWKLQLERRGKPQHVTVVADREAML